MSRYFLSFFLSIVSFTLHAQIIYEDQAIGFADSLIKPEKHSFEILVLDIPPDLQTIISKYQYSMKTNAAWYAEYEKSTTQRPLAYHKNFGITKDEYKRMLAERPKLKMKVKDVKTINVSKENGIITFKGDNGFNVWDDITIDTKKYKILLRGSEIPFRGQISEGEDSNYGSWRGFHWELEEGSIEALKSLTNSDYKLYSIKIGTTSDKRTLLQFKAVYVENAQYRINGTISGYLL